MLLYSIFCFGLAFFFLLIVNSLCYLIEQLSETFGPLFDLTFCMLFLYLFSLRNSFTSSSSLTSEEQVSQGVLGIINLHQEVSIILFFLLFLVSLIMFFSIYYYDNQRFSIGEFTVKREREFSFKTALELGFIVFIAVLYGAYFYFLATFYRKNK